MFQICKDTYKYKVISFYIVHRPRSYLKLCLPSLTDYILLSDHWYTMTTLLSQVGTLHIITHSTQITHSNEWDLVVIFWFPAICRQFNVYFLRESEWSDIRYARHILQSNDHKVNMWTVLNLLLSPQQNSLFLYHHNLSSLRKLILKSQYASSQYAKTEDEVK